MPQPADEARGALHPLVGPFQGLLRGRGEHDEEARGVGAESLDQAFGVHTVALGLRHLPQALVRNRHGAEVGCHHFVHLGAPGRAAGVHLGGVEVALASAGGLV